MGKLLIAIIFFSFPIFGLKLVETLEYPVSNAYIPDGFDDDDYVEWMITGSFPNTCYQVGLVETDVDTANMEIGVKLTAYKYDGKCSSYPAPFQVVVKAGLLPRSGNFQVVDRANGKELGKLQIKKALENGPGTDEVNYAFLLDTFITDVNQKPTLVLRALLPSSCLTLSAVKLLPQNETVVVLPTIEKKTGVSCKDGEYPIEFKRVVTELLPKGRFLLHARSMGGNAINKWVIQ